MIRFEIRFVTDVGELLWTSPDNWLRIATINVRAANTSTQEVLGYPFTPGGERICLCDRYFLSCAYRSRSVYNRVQLEIPCGLATGFPYTPLLDRRGSG